MVQVGGGRKQGMENGKKRKVSASTSTSASPAKKAATSASKPERKEPEETKLAEKKPKKPVGKKKLAAKKPAEKKKLILDLESEPSASQSPIAAKNVGGKRKRSSHPSKESPVKTLALKKKPTLKKKVSMYYKKGVISIFLVFSQFYWISL